MPPKTYHSGMFVRMERIAHWNVVSYKNTAFAQKKIPRNRKLIIKACLCFQNVRKSGKMCYFMLGRLQPHKDRQIERGGEGGSETWEGLTSETSANWEGRRGCPRPPPSTALSLPSWGSLYCLPSLSAHIHFPQKLTLANNDSPGRQAPVQQPGEKKAGIRRPLFQD